MLQGSMKTNFLEVIAEFSLTNSAEAFINSFVIFKRAACSGLIQKEETP